ncbi:hypothetical protein PR048_007953 [Dryococelus australis]|uniref:Uncharacterized protein n=1 Tax=Dryococelus australis TaxID=614101 RepID=A0ABQ9HVQ3_9NEOP|nr:hypothetical protein PR048_007953 [Dryococelus australis]
MDGRPAWATTSLSTVAILGNSILSPPSMFLMTRARADANVVGSSNFVNIAPLIRSLNITERNSILHAILSRRHRRRAWLCCGRRGSVAESILARNPAASRRFPIVRVDTPGATYHLIPAVDAIRSASAVLTMRPIVTCVCATRPSRTWYTDMGPVQLTTVDNIAPLRMYHDQTCAAIRRYVHPASPSPATRRARGPQWLSGTGSIPGWVTPDFRMWESYRAMLVGGFSRGSPVFPALSFRRCSILISVALIGSQYLDNFTDRRLRSMHASSTSWETGGPMGQRLRIRPMRRSKFERAGNRTCFGVLVSDESCYYTTTAVVWVTKILEMRDRFSKPRNPCSTALGAVSNELTTDVRSSGCKSLGCETDGWMTNELEGLFEVDSGGDCVSPREGTDMSNGCSVGILSSSSEETIKFVAKESEPFIISLKVNAPGKFRTWGSSGEGGMQLGRASSNSRVEKSFTNRSTFRKSPKFTARGEATRQTGKQAVLDLDENALWAMDRGSLQPSQFQKSPAATVLDDRANSLLTGSERMCYPKLRVCNINAVTVEARFCQFK